MAWRTLFHVGRLVAGSVERLQTTRSLPKRTRRTGERRWSATALRCAQETVINDQSSGVVSADIRTVY